MRTFIFIFFFCLLPVANGATPLVDTAALFEQPETVGVGWPSRSADFDVLPGFENPPPGYGEVPFYWWTGDRLTKERLAWQLDLLCGKTMPGVPLPGDCPAPRISGMQVNLAHARGDHYGNGFGLFGPSYRLDPPIFSQDFWELWRWYVGECDARGLGIGISDYTLGWPGQHSFVDEVLAENPDMRGKFLKRDIQQLQAGETWTRTPLENEIVTLAVPLTDGKPNFDKVVVIDTKMVSWDAPETAPTQLHRYYWVYENKAVDALDPNSGKAIADRFFGQAERETNPENRKALNYFFQDELHLGLGSFGAWTPAFAESFEKTKGYDILPKLPLLFDDSDPEAAKIKLDYNDVLMLLSEAGYFAPVGNWHRDRGMIYGCDQAGRGTNPYEFGDYFRAVRWFTAPGHDTPGTGADIIKGKASSSISHLYQKPRVWLEGYHSAGWGMTLENLTNTTCENYAVGCNLLCLHGLYYSTHGSFWEWAPPCYHWRMPYWRHTGVWFKYFERLSYLLSQGNHVADIAILYPVEQFAAGYDGNAATRLAFGVGERLYRKGVDFDFIDGQSIERATMKDGVMSVSGENYRVLVLPSMQALRWNTLEKIAEFHKNGGIVIALENLPKASDRIGENDEKLDNLVQSVFGSTAKDPKPNSTVKETIKEMGNGIFLVSVEPEPQEQTQPQTDEKEKSASKKPPRRKYPGGFEGRWVWPETATKEAFFKTIWQGPDADVAVRFAADNHGYLYLNGKEIAEDVEYSSGWTGTLALKSGDILAAYCLDDDNAGNPTAGMFFAAVVDGKTILTAEDFKCSATKPTDEQLKDADTQQMGTP
ncbi:MAG: glycosyl hydrolase, partial [Thermoguttaceae bacterium]